MKWYWCIVLYFVKGRWSYDLEGNVLTGIRYKRCCGHMFVLEESREVLHDTRTLNNG